MSLINKFQRKTQMNRSLKVDMTSIFQGRDTNLDRLVDKNQHTHRISTLKYRIKEQDGINKQGGNFSEN